MLWVPTVLLLLSFLGAGMALAKDKAKPRQSGVMILTAANWNKAVLRVKKPVLVDFWAT